MHILHYFHQKTFDIATVVNFGVVVVDSRGGSHLFLRGRREKKYSSNACRHFFFKKKFQIFFRKIFKFFFQKNEVEYLLVNQSCKFWRGVEDFFTAIFFFSFFLNASIHFLLLFVNLMIILGFWGIFNVYPYGFCIFLQLM